MIIPVHSFCQIKLIPGALVVLDIDETLLTYSNLSPKWWQDEIKKHYLETNDQAIAEKKALCHWKSLVRTSLPVSLDTNNRTTFIDNLYKMGCELIFLTARDDDLADITRSHLSALNIYNDQKIYFDENKGSKIIEIITFHKNYDHIIVVDDLMRNLVAINDSLQKQMPKKSFQLYQIQHQRA
jgi:hypothetical protein